MKRKRKAINCNLKREISTPSR